MSDNANGRSKSKFPPEDYEHCHPRTRKKRMKVLDEGMQNLFA